MEASTRSSKTSSVGQRPNALGESMLPTVDTQRARRPLDVLRLGIVPYGDALELQKELVAKRRAGEIHDTLLLLEHPHVITLGTSSHTDHILLDEAERKLMGIELCKTGRGGDVTYHGPGQLVGYPILDLKPDRCDLHQYMRDLEEVLIRTLAAFDVVGTRRHGLTGVWVGDEKIAAIGIRVSSSWITSHGFALNVSNDVRFFEAIVPCGIRDRGVTSVGMFTSVSIDEVVAVLTTEFCSAFSRDCNRVE